MKKKIYLKAWTRANLGDDLFVKILCERYPDVDFYCDIFPGYYNKTIKHNNLLVEKEIRLFSPIIIWLDSFIKNSNLSGHIHHFLNGIWHKIIYTGKRVKQKETFDASVFIGGSVYFDNGEVGKNLDLSSITLSPDIITAKKTEKPSFVIGANVGPLYNIDYLKDYIANEIAQNHAVCFRDKTSYNLFSFLPTVSYAPDVIFNLDLSGYEGIETKKTISVVSIDLDAPIRRSIEIKNETFCKKIVKILTEYISKGYHINIISFCKHEMDERIATMIYKALPKDNRSAATLLKYNGNNCDNVIKALAESEYILAGRFHAMILSSMLKKPFFPICYNDKMFNYLSDLGFNGNYIDIEDFEKTDFSFINQNLSNNYLTNVDLHIKNASMQFAELDKFIER